MGCWEKRDSRAGRSFQAEAWWRAIKEAGTPGGTGARGSRAGQRRGAGAGGEGVEPAVVADVDDVVAVGVGAGEADTGGEGFAAGFEEADGFGAGMID